MSGKRLRLPAGVLSDYDCEVLVIDDASDDSTFEHGLRYRQSHADLPLTVLRNRSNQGTRDIELAL